MDNDYNGVFTRGTIGWGVYMVLIITMPYGMFLCQQLVLAGGVDFASDGIGKIPYNPALGTVLPVMRCMFPTKTYNPVPVKIPSSSLKRRKTGDDYKLNWLKEINQIEHLEGLVYSVLAQLPQLLFLPVWW